MSLGVGRNGEQMVSLLPLVGVYCVDPLSSQEGYEVHEASVKQTGGLESKL